MSTELILTSFLLFTFLLFVVSFLTSRRAGNDTFFTGERKMSWIVVAYGMIGATLSGVTFISIPGDVYNSYFSYLMVVIGYLAGYAVIAFVLLPVFYKLRVTTIYTYLKHRYGLTSYKTGSYFFIISKLFGAAGRLFLVAYVLHNFIFEAMNVPFVITAILFIALIMIYTFRAGIKTVVWTDTLQTTFMILSLILSFYFISKSLNVSFAQLINKVFNHDYSKMVITDWHSRYNFLKQFIGGAFIAMTMTGLDQDMMQKNLSCKDLKSAQKNVVTMSLTMVPVILMFLILGVALYIFADANAIPVVKGQTDNLFPSVMLKHLGGFAGIFFLIGLISAAYSSGDGALTSLTTTFCIDILDFDGKRSSLSENKKKNLRTMVHFSFAFLMIIIMLIFKKLNNNAIITTIFDIAGYTYGPLLGLFALGLFSKINLNDRLVPLIAILAPIGCYILGYVFQRYFNYAFGFEKILINGLLTTIGLLMIRKKDTKAQLTSDTK